MYIPSIRDKYKTPLFNNTRGAKETDRELNPYYEQNLTEANKGAIRGFDFCVDSIKAFNTCYKDTYPELTLVDEKAFELTMNALFDYLEIDRNTLGVTLIENQDEKDEK